MENCCDTKSSRKGYQVAITGMGIVSSLECNLKAVSENLYNGKSDIVLDPKRLELGFRSGLTATIRDFELKHYDGLSRKALRTMCEPARYAYGATHDAIIDAGLSKKMLHSERCGIIFGNDSCTRSVDEALEILRKHGETHFIGSGSIFKIMNSTVTMNLATLLGIKGANWTISSACSSGANAIGQATMLIKSGMQDIVLAGGAQELSWQSMISFDALGVFSLHSEPLQASCPFDKSRDGLVPSGGAACLILEELSYAKSRGAKIYGIISGYGFSSDGDGHLSNPNLEGTEQAIRMALKDANVSPEQIEYINAHATSTPIGDRVEAAVINKVFGSKVPVSSTKSISGHECWMAGASEVLYTTLMANGGFIAANKNFTEQEDGCMPIHVVKKTIDTKFRLAISNSFGFGGTNSVLVLDYSNCRL